MVKRLFELLAHVHEQVESADPKIDTLEAKIRELEPVMGFFFKNPLKPLQTTEKFYDHALRCHLVDIMRQLEAAGLTLAVLSSKYLEALNKTVKAILKRLTGGGGRTAGKRKRTADDVGARLPIAQGYKKICAVARVQREALYKLFARNM